MLMDDPAAIAEAASYAASHGLVMARSKGVTTGTDIVHAPLTFSPTPFHAPCYRHAIRITPALNTLINRIANDHAYLRHTLAPTAKADPFTARLLAMLDVANPANRGVQLSIVRYDYFMHAAAQRDYELRMVEMNCIAASYICLGTNMSSMHRFMATHPSTKMDLQLDKLPTNDAMHAIPKGLAAAHHAFVRTHLTNHSSNVVLVMVVQPADTNSYDQDLLRNTLWEKHQLNMIRLSLADIHAHASLQPDATLLLDLPNYPQPLIASVVYFRAAYTPNDFPTDRHWEARTLIEKSNAVKCPSVAMQLVGTKRIQQVLDEPGQLEKFLPTEDARQIRATFARQYAFSSDESTETLVKKAIANPQDYVLKPQREGGGNNLYSQQLKNALSTMTVEQLSAFVLMDRIRPPQFTNVIIRNGVATLDEVVSELGVFGVHVSIDGREQDNYDAGILLRSKPAATDDGGVSAGVALLDSPLLFE